MFFYRYRCATPRPSRGSLYRAGAVYVDTHVGVLARLDADSGTLDWGYGYKTDAFQSMYRFFYYYQPQEPTVGAAARRCRPARPC